MPEQSEIRGQYPRIPDHSDLRGFSYRAPVNYRWSDDHGAATPYPSHNGHFTPLAAKQSRDLWRSVKSGLKAGPKGYTRPDERIHEDICEALMHHPGIDASEIEVSVREGVVDLRGTVPNRWMKRASEWAADRISGVKDVENHLRLRAPPSDLP